MTASPATPSDHGLRTAFPATLLIALAALAAVAPLATDAYLPAFAQMADDLGVSASSVQLTMTTFLVGIALGQLGIGVLSDRVGRRPLLLWGSVLALAASIGAALSPSLPVLLIARFFQGLGGAAGMVLGRAVISDRSRGITAARALSVVMAIQGIAPVVAPILGGVLVEPIGWRGILRVVAAFTGLLVVMVVLWVPESLPAERRHDGGLVSPLVGLTGEASGAAFGVVIVAVGVIANILAVFGLRERGEKERMAAQEAERQAHRLGE